MIPYYIKEIKSKVIGVSDKCSWMGKKGISMYNKHFYLLQVEAAKLGYRVRDVSEQYVSSCYHLTKEIKISKKHGETKSIFEFAHELGHCVQFERRRVKYNWDKESAKQFYRERDKSKFKFMIDELDAWLRGYPILKKNKINTYGYWLHAMKCLVSHLKTKPNRVKD